MPNYHSEVGYHRRASNCEQGVQDFVYVMFFFVLPLWALGTLIKKAFGRSTFSASEMAAFEHAAKVKKELSDVQKLVGPDKPPTDYAQTIAISGTGPKPPAPPTGAPPTGTPST